MSNSRIISRLLLTAAFAAGAVATVADAQNAKPKSIYDCLGSGFAAYDALLGTPKVNKTEEKIAAAGNYTREQLAAWEGV